MLFFPQVYGCKQMRTFHQGQRFTRRLDELVYALYGLTPEVKALVHPASAEATARHRAAAK